MQIRAYIHLHRLAAPRLRWEHTLTAAQQQHLAALRAKLRAAIAADPDESAPIEITDEEWDAYTAARDTDGDSGDW
jgi:hypothetical protein